MRDAADRPGCRRARMRRRRAGWVLALGVLGILVAGLLLARAVLGRPWETFRTTPEHDPPVLAGQVVPAGCSGGFYARRGEEVVLTISGHCAVEDQELRGRDGVLVGVAGRPAREATCPHVGHSCWASDLIEVVLAPDAIPWGHLDQVDLGAGGYRVIPPGTAPLGCDDLRAGAQVETNGRGRYRRGTLLAIEAYLFPPEQDGSTFPCVSIADIRVETGDSGGAVLADGLPAGVVSREISGYLGFTPLAEGLELLGLELCSEPDCGLAPPAR